MEQKQEMKGRVCGVGREWRQNSFGRGSSLHMEDMEDMEFWTVGDNWECESLGDKPGF